MRRRGVAGRPGKCKAVMAGSNGDGLRTRLLTGTIDGVPMAWPLWVKWIC